MFKSKRQRLLAVGVLILVATAVGAVAWVYRQKQMDRNIAAMGPRGVADYQAGDYLEALTKLSIYLRKHPDDVDMLYTFAQARLKVEDSKGRHIAQGRDTLRRVIELDPKRLDARRDLMKLYAAIGFLTEAIQTAEGVLKLAPDDREAILTKAVSLAQFRTSDRLQEALKTLDAAGVLAAIGEGKAPALPPEPRELREHLLVLQILQTLDAIGEPCRVAPTWNQAILEYGKVIAAAYPDHPGMLLVEAAAQRVVGDRQRAQELLAQASQGTLDATLTAQLAGEFDSLGKFAEATNVLARGVAESGDPGLRKALARRLWQSGRLKELAELLMPVDPAAAEADAELIVLRILSAHALGNADHARELAAQIAKRRNDQVAEAWAPLLNQVILTGEDVAPAKLLELTTAALGRLPRDPHILMLHGSAHVRLRDHQRAIDAWTNAARAAAPWHLPYLRLSRLYSADGRGDEAWAAAIQADLRAPGRLEVAVAYALAAAAIGEPRIDPARLLELVEKIQAASAHEPETLVLYLTLLARLERADDARKVLQQLLAATDKTLPENLLLRLAGISHGFQLGATDALLERSAEAHGVSPAWGIFQARLKLAAGDAPAALKEFEAARQNARATGEKSQWALAWAELLTLAADDRAAAEWKALAAAYPDDLSIQRAAIGARPMQNDREFLSTVIDRVRRLAGEDNIDWRMARARWLLAGDESRQAAAEAALLLQEVLRLSADEVEARRLLAFALQRTNSIAGAIEQLELAVNQRPDRSDLALELAGLLQSQSDFERARQQIDRVLDNRAATLQQKRQAGAMLFEQGDTGAAIAVLQEAAAASPGKPDLLLARFLWRQNDIPAARDIFNKLLEAEQKNPVLLQFAADFFASQGDRERADQLLAQLGQVELKPGVVNLILADHYNRYGDPDKAAVHYRAATDAMPDNAFAWRQSAAFLFNAGQLKEALQCVADAAKKLPDDAVLTRMHQERDLLAATEQLTSLRPLIAAALVRPDQQDAAIETVRLVVDAQRRSGEIQAGAEDFQQKQELQKHLQSDWSAKLRLLADRNPRFAALQTMAATSYLAIGQHDQAIRIATRAMQSFPTSPEPAAVATTALGAGRRWNEMLATARQWRDRSPGQPLAADMAIAGASLALDQPQAAIEALKTYIESAVAAGPEATQIVDLYTRALIGAGRVDEAAALLSPRLAEPEAKHIRDTWWRLAVSMPQREQADAWLSRLEAAVPEAALDERVRIAEAWRLLGRRFNHEPYTAAGEQAIAALAARPDATALVHFTHGSIAEVAGDLALAETHYRRAIELDANAALAKNNLAMVLATQRKDLDSALKFASEAAAALPGVAAVQDTLAYVHFARQQPAQAVEPMMRAAMLQPQNPEGQLSYAWILAEAGRRDDARKVYGEVQPKLPPVDQLSDAGRQRLAMLQKLIPGVPETP